MGVLEQAQSIVPPGSGFCQPPTPIAVCVASWLARAISNLPAQRRNSGTTVHPTALPRPRFAGHREAAPRQIPKGPGFCPGPVELNRSRFEWILPESAARD